MGVTLESAQSIRVRRALLAGGFTAVLAGLGIGRLGYPAILPYMRAGLSLTNAQMGFLATANLIGYLLSSVSVGYIATRAPGRRIIAISMLSLALVLASLGFAPGFEFALVTQFLIGVFGAGAVVTSLGMIPSRFPAATRGLATGLAIGGSGVGQLIASFVVSKARAEFGAEAWRYSWFLLGASVLVLFFVAQVTLAGDRKASDTFVRSARSSPGSIRNEVYRNSLVWYVALLSVFFALAFVSYYTFFVEYLLNDLSYPEQTAGWLWSLVAIGSASSGVVWGWLSDRHGRKTSIVLAFATLSTALGLLHLPVPAIPALALSAVLFGNTMFSTLAIIAAIFGDRITPQFTSAAIGFSIVLFSCAQIVGVALAGWLADLTGNFKLTFSVAFGFALMGTLMALFLNLDGPSGKGDDHAMEEIPTWER